MSKINEGLQILLNWETEDPTKIKSLVVNFYERTEFERRKPLGKQLAYIAPYITYIDNPTKLLEQVYSTMDGQSGVEDLIIYILQNDRRFTNSDTVENFQSQTPFPSYLIYFAYILIFLLPKRSRKLFEAFWEHQAVTPLGISEDSAKKFLDPFIEEGVTTKQEIQDLIIRDWKRWQESPDDSPYYGEPYGVAVWYFPNYSWDSVKKKLEDEWREKTGKEPKR